MSPPLLEGLGKDVKVRHGALAIEAASFFEARKKDIAESATLVGTLKHKLD